jgi:hypothetical protein
MAKLGNVTNAIAELEQTCSTGSDAVIYCEDVLDDFVHSADSDAVLPADAIECVQETVSAILDHISAVGQQISLEIEKQERETATIAKRVQDCSLRAYDKIK